MYPRVEGLAYRTHYYNISYLNSTVKTKHKAIGDYYEVTPEEHGTTALLVEMKDNYKGELLDKIKGEDEVWKFIKAITLLPINKQKVIDSKSSPNPGVLLNINQPLNKFFIALKGDVLYRLTTGCFAPFYNGWEQISPNGEETTEYPNGIYIKDAYDAMLDPTKDYPKFEVNHNCVSVPARAHAVMMYDWNYMEQIHTNMFVYIPDYRFWTKDNTTNFNQYNAKHPVGDKEYDTYPCFFIYKVNITDTDADKTVDAGDYTPAGANTEDNSEVWVPLTVNSTLKKITNDSEKESFRIERSYDGGASWTVVPVADFNTDAPLEDGNIVSANGSAGFYVREHILPEDQRVLYRTISNVTDTGFDPMSSATDYADIPGSEIKTTPDLRIAVQHQSTFDANKQQNNYVNIVTIKSADELSDRLRVRHIDWEGNTTSFQLRRYKVLPEQSMDYTIDNGDLVATITLAKDGEGYTATVEQNGVTADPVAVPVTAECFGDANGEWLTVVDGFSRSVAESVDRGTYSYRLFATNVINAVDRLGNEITDLRSNRAVVVVPDVMYNVGFDTYSLEEIESDHDAHLSVSQPKIGFSFGGGGAGVNNCDIRLTDDFTTDIVVAAKTKQGIWQLNAYDKTGTKTAEGVAQAGVNEASIGVDPSLMNTEVVMFITAGDNTYGTPRRYLPVLPVVSVSIPSISKSGKGYNVSSNIAVSVNDAFDSNFDNHGYGVWRLENVVYLQDVKEINGLAHHFSPSAPEQTMSFAYMQDGIGTGIGKLGQANAEVAETRGLQSEAAVMAAAEEAKPEYSVWLRVRHYARYTHEDMDASDPARYVVTENRAGSRYEEGQTVGVADIIAGDDTNGTATYYNLQGMQIPAQALQPGVYLRNCGGIVTKVVVK